MQATRTSLLLRWFWWALFLACTCSHEAAAHHPGTEQQSAVQSDPVRNKRYKQIEVLPQAWNTATCVLGVWSSGTESRLGARRKLIRKTWATSSTFLPATNIQLLFVLYNFTLTADARAMVMREAAQYNDILLLNDSYSGHSGSKVFDFLKWAAAEYPNMRYVAKMDEDVWLHPFNFQRLLTTMLPMKLVYWGALQQTSEGHVYMRGALWVLSQELLQQLVNSKQAVIQEVISRHNSSWPSGQELGEVIQATTMARPQIEVFAAADFELYDWGDDKDTSFTNTDAELGLLPPETIAVTALTHNADYRQVHDYFISSLLRWRACVGLKFAAERCHEVLNFEQNLSC